MVIMLVLFLGTVWLYRMPLTLSLFQSLQLIFVELLVVTAIALFFSTFSSSLLSAILTLGFYLVGHATVDLRGLAQKGDSHALKAFTTALYYVFPNFEMLNIKGQAAVGIPVGFDYLFLASAYGLTYAALLITGACLVFSRRDF
jgi:hypothetical protein